MCLHILCPQSVCAVVQETTGGSPQTESNLDEDPVRFPGEVKGDTLCTISSPAPCHKDSDTGIYKGVYCSRITRPVMHCFSLCSDCNLVVSTERHRALYHPLWCCAFVWLSNSQTCSSMQSKVELLTHGVVKHTGI